MNILFVTENHSIKNYGITTVVSQLADELIAIDSDIHLHILATCAESIIQNPKINITLIPPSKFGRFWGWSSSLSKTMDELIEQNSIDVIHIHGIWMAAQRNALRIAQRRQIPCVVSAHGMLEPWLWHKQSRLQKYKKMIYFNLIFRPVLTKATIFHAITPIEKENLSQQLPNNHSIVTIPNAINLENEGQKQNYIDKILDKQFLFLGRLHPIKGVEILIDAFYHANLGQEWHLIIAGPESDPVYSEKLKKQVLKLGLSEKIIFQGSISGKVKEDFLRKSWAIVVPSFSEVIGMVNLEAAKYSTPSITTFETGLFDWEEGGGILIHPEVDGLSTALKRASQWTLEQRLQRGQRSFQLVAERYSWNTVIVKWINFYHFLLSNHRKGKE